MTAITKDTIKFLELHAMEYQNKKIELANQYISDYKKYIHVLNFLNSYIHSIENYIDRADPLDGPPSVPFVIIGSVVDMRDASDNKKCTVRIREPGNNQGDSSYEEVSCLSGLGKALLFKEPGQKIEFKEAGCTFLGTIEQIQYNFSL